MFITKRKHLQIVADVEAKGDKPGDDTGGGFAAQKALEWAEEFQQIMGEPA